MNGDQTRDSKYLDYWNTSVKQTENRHQQTVTVTAET